MTVYRRKDGRYEGRIYKGINDCGKRVYSSVYGHSKEEVIRKLESDRGSNDDGAPLTDMTVRELFEEWFNALASRIKISTAANYRMKAEKHIIPIFGNEVCSLIKKKTVYTFIEDKLKIGLSPRYVTDILVLMKSLFKYAHREYNVKNVFDGIIMPKKTKEEVRILTTDEQSTLKRFISDNPNLKTLGVALSMYTGIRIGELCSLTWEDIDLSKRTLTVRKTIQRIQCFDGSCRTKLMIAEPKSESSKRIIPIPDCLIKMLEEFRSDDKAYVLSGVNDPIEPRNMQYHFAKILRKADLPSVHFHSLRHAFASNAVALGFDVKTLSELLGHSSVELTLNRYVHSSMERKRSCMELLKWSA